MVQATIPCNSSHLSLRRWRGESGNFSGRKAKSDGPAPPVQAAALQILPRWVGADCDANPGSPGVQVRGGVHPEPRRSDRIAGIRGARRVGSRDDEIEHCRGEKIWSVRVRIGRNGVWGSAVKEGLIRCFVRWSSMFIRISNRYFQFEFGHWSLFKINQWLKGYNDGELMTAVIETNRKMYKSVIFIGQCYPTFKR